MNEQSKEYKEGYNDAILTSKNCITIATFITYFVSIILIILGRRFLTNFDNAEYLISFVLFFLAPNFLYRSLINKEIYRG